MSDITEQLDRAVGGAAHKRSFTKADSRMLYLYGRKPHALDALPHNGAVITVLGICGLTHREAYGDIFVVAVLVPMIASGSRPIGG